MMKPANPFKSRHMFVRIDVKIINDISLNVNVVYNFLYFLGWKIPMFLVTVRAGVWLWTRECWANETERGREAESEIEKKREDVMAPIRKKATIWFHQNGHMYFMCLKSQWSLDTIQWCRMNNNNEMKWDSCHLMSNPHNQMRKHVMPTLYHCLLQPIDSKINSINQYSCIIWLRTKPI